MMLLLYLYHRILQDHFAIWSRPGKHALTLDFKAAAEFKPKKFAGTINDNTLSHILPHRNNYGKIIVPVLNAT